MKILGIETSCDETAAAVVVDGCNVLSNIISSQIDIHSRYGGIVPEVASRQHLLAIVPVIRKALTAAGTDLGDIDAVAVTYGPGLAGSLIVGVNIAKSIALSHKTKLIGINHLEGHIYANWIYGTAPKFPAACLIVSGGHTDIVLMHGHGHYEPVGRTRDDAAGEAFDKVARILDLGYPGGPAIEKSAINGDGSKHRLPRAWLKDTDDFSFSGLKTSVLHLSQTLKKTASADVAASFQEAVADVLVSKTIAAAQRLKARNILLCGGVAANQSIRNRMIERSNIPVLTPPTHLCTDNAAMIAACAYHRIKNSESSAWDLDVLPNLKLK